MRAATLHVSVVIVALYAGFQPMFVDADAFAFLDAHASQYTQELIDLVQIPSISSLPGMSIRMSMLNMRPQMCSCVLSSYAVAATNRKAYFPMQSTRTIC